MSTQRTQAPESVDNAHNRAVALDPLENNIGATATSSVVAANVRFQAVAKSSSTADMRREVDVIKLRLRHGVKQ